MDGVSLSYSPITTGWETPGASKNPRYKLQKYKVWYRNMVALESGYMGAGTRQLGLRPIVAWVNYTNENLE